MHNTKIFKTFDDATVCAGREKRQILPKMPCGHSHDHGGPSSGRPLNEGASGVEYSLYSKIIMDDVECLNEAEENSGRSVFKSWENRLDKEKVRFVNNQFLKMV